MDETRKAPSPKDVLGHLSPSSRRRPSSRKRASRPGPARSVARRCGRPCRSPGHACKGRHAVVCVAVRPHARLPREASMSVTQSAALSGGRRGRFASRPLACAPAGFDFWRIFGALGGQIWLARAKFVPYAAVYGTEGQRFESSRARSTKRRSRAKSWAGSCRLGTVGWEQERCHEVTGGLDRAPVAVRSLGVCWRAPIDPGRLSRERTPRLRPPPSP
jgi:hypothetical protein